ncbi:MAG: ATP-binding protein [Candidatus Parabeggiatoa sp. nov. 1]|nr:MAG: ATP-binding protein [Gammaproteobacteria bacterium]
MKSHFIKNIAIANFKCFQKLQLDGMESVNLFGGKNNVGKTAFLEAVELLVSSNETYDLAVNIYNLLTRRQLNQDSTDLILDLIKEDQSQIKISTENKICEMYLNKQTDGFGFDPEFNEEMENIIPTTSLSLAINGNEKSIPVERLLTTKMPLLKERNLKRDNVNLIGSAKTEEREIAVLYGSLVDLDREDFLNDSLRLFDDNIISIKQRATKNNVILKLKLKDRQTPVLLSSLGEGLNRYIAVLCAIWASKDGFLLIDEVENGIHYTNYKKLWHIIFQASAEANCQLFITSHSKECLEAFNEVQLEDNKNSGAYFEFYKNLKTDLITASKRDKEQLNYSLTHQGRLRGE